MKATSFIFSLLISTTLFGQNPAILKTVGGSVLEPKNVDQNEWENNAWNGKHFYQGTGTPTKLVVTDGTAAGTQYVKDIGSGAILVTIPAMDFMYVITSRLITSPSFAVVHEIWKSDGTSAGTVLVKTMDAFSFSAQGNNYTSDGQNKRNYAVTGNIMIFGGWDPLNGRELWRTDGTAAGTYLVKDIKPGVGDSYTSNFAKLNDGFVYFRAAASGLGTTLWRTDGTAAGTTEIAVPNLTVTSIAVGLVNNKLIFYGNDNGVSGSEPWVSDGTVAGTFRLADVNPGSANSSPNTLQNLLFRFNDKYCFFISQTSSGKSLWRTDGTQEGTIQLTPDGLINEDNFSGGGYCAIRNSGLFWIGANNRLYFSDGTTAGTRLLRSDLLATNLYMYKEAAWFKNVTGNTAAPTTLEGEPWRSDGTAPNTAKALDVYMGNSGAFINSSNPYGFFSLNNRLYFFGTRATPGGNIHLFEYNGDMTFNGTVPGGRWGDSANWNSQFPPGITDTAYVAAGLTAHVNGAKAWAGTLIMNAGSSVNLVASTDTLTIHRSLLGTAATGNGVVQLRNVNGDTSHIVSTFTATNINADGRVSLLNNVTINNQLSLTGNARVLVNDATLTLGGNSSSITHDPSNYIVTNSTGKLEIQDIGPAGRSGTVVFPVGTETAFNPVYFRNTGGIDAFSIRVQNGIYSNYSGEQHTGGAYTSAAVNATWFISEAVPGGSNASIGLQWNAAQELPAFDRSQSRMGHYTAGSWQLGAPGLATGTNPYQWVGSGYIAFSPFGILNNGLSLPVYEVQLRVNRVANGNRCQWHITGDEIGETTLQRSINGQQFYDIYQGGSLPEGSYDDRRPMNSKVYYRLRVKETSGGEKYSAVVWINEQDDKGPTIYPTIISNHFYVQQNRELKAKVQVFDGTGNLVVEALIGPGNNRIETKVLKKGVYFYRVIEDDNHISTGKLVKAD